MPSVAQETPTVPSCKKRRRDDIELANAGLSLSPSHHNNASTRSIFSDKTFEHGTIFHHHHHNYHSNLSTRRIMPLPPTNKRQRVSSGDSPTNPSHQRQLKQPRGMNEDVQQLLQEKSVNSRTPATPIRTTICNATTAANMMSRCHICYRKPSKKSDLDSFADCQACGQRTCYVCIRECLGWRPGLMQQRRQSHWGAVNGIGGQQQLNSSPNSDSSFNMLDADDAPGTGSDMSRDEAHRQDRPHRPQEEDSWRGNHRQMVCSQCSVERGQDGDVVCLGCLPFIEG
ncbi:hypothetical protein B0T25DRAFT_346415 [Lasiosphaeria hispida]|uniref:Uncharacterized protein n=1 Tax=Lasiosphaeria hispida TaxID=260671 RepID=A0AAJ0M8E3_9PEZI|nr:hypothetical protein B0T25DRAFT_346415 [Lasiosphaeria hispida]